MRRSRKGTKLNDLQYFRTPLPHARKRMTILRVIPRMMSFQLGRDNKPENETRDSLEREQICFDQRSVEVSMEEYLRDCESEIDHFHSDRRDVYVNTGFNELYQPYSVRGGDERNFLESHTKSSKDFGNLCVKDPSLEVTTISYTNDRFATSNVKSKVMQAIPRSICEMSVLNEDPYVHAQSVTVKPVSALQITVRPSPTTSSGVQCLQDQDSSRTALQTVQEKGKVVADERSKEMRRQIYNSDSESTYYAEPKFIIPWKKSEYIVERLDVQLGNRPNLMPQKANTNWTNQSLLTLSGCGSTSSVNCITQDAQVFTESKYIIPKSLAKIKRRQPMTSCPPRSTTADGSANSSDTRRSQDEKSKKSSWWRDRGLRKVVFDFFGQIFSLRRSKPPSRRKSTPSKTDRMMSKVNGVCNNNTRIIREPNIPITDIHLKADESLRAAYVENVLWARKLEEENARYRKVLRCKLQSRKMSSPLY